MGNSVKHFWSNIYFWQLLKYWVSCRYEIQRNWNGQLLSILQRLIEKFGKFIWTEVDLRSDCYFFRYSTTKTYEENVREFVFISISIGFEKSIANCTGLWWFVQKKILFRHKLMDLWLLEIVEVNYLIIFKQWRKTVGLLANERNV